MTQHVLLKFISLRHLFREKRNWLTLIGVALGISVFVSIRIANLSVLSTYKQSVDAFAGKTTLEVVGRSGAMDETILTLFRQDPTISQISPLVQSVLPIATPSSAAGEVLLLMGVDLLQEGVFRDYEFSGDFDGAGDESTLTQAFERLLNPESIFLPEVFAKRHHLKVGDPLSLRKEGNLLNFKVAGLLGGEGIARSRDGNIGIIDIATAQWRLEKLGQLDRIDLMTDEEISLETIITRLDKTLGEQVLIRRPQQRNKQIEKMLFSFQMNLTALSAISLFVGLFLIYNTLLVSVVHRRKEIGLLRALGVDRKQIFRLFTIEGIVIGTVGGFLGVLIGALLARWVVQVLSQTVSTLYVPIPPSPFSLPLALFIEGVVIGVLVSTFSAIYPAWQAARLKPREALEGVFGSEAEGLAPQHLLKWSGFCALLSFGLSQMPINWGFSWNGYAAAGLLLMAFSLIVPSSILLFSKGVYFLSRNAAPSWRLAQGHLERAIRRNAPTISAFMAALAMMVSVVIMIESFRTTVVLWIDQTIQSDILVFPASYMVGDSDETLPDGLREEMLQVPEIEAVDAYRSRFVLFRNESVELVGRHLDIHAKYSTYLFRKGDATQIMQRAVVEREALISEVLANRFQLEEGDVIPIPTPQGNVDFKIGGVFYDYGTDGGKIVINRSHFKKYWTDHKVDVAAIYLKSGADVGRTRDHLLTRWGNKAGISFTTQTTFKKEIMDIFDQTFLITYALEWIAIFVALLGIANTLFVSVLERKREIGILRAIGASRPQVIRIVLLEALYMGVIGNLIALVCGYFLSLLLIFVINKASFGWTLQFYFPPEIIMHSFFLAIGVALIAGYLPAKRASKTDLKEAVAYE